MNELSLEALSRGRRAWAFLALLSLALFLPGIADLPPVDRDEARYLQASRQMLETGDWVRIRFQDEARNKKPAGVYWLQAAAMAASGAGTAAWPARLVSVAGATLAVLLCCFFGERIFDRQTGFLGAALLAATADLVFEAHVATTDAVLLPAAVAAQGTLALAYLAARRREALSVPAALVFWLAQGLALMIKGPVVPLLSLMTAAVLSLADRRARWLLALRPLSGLALALAIAAPWLYLIQRDTGGAFLQESVGHDLIGKVLGSQEAHGAVPGYYLALLPVTFWPATLLLGPALTWAWRSRKLPGSRLLIAWVVPFWIVLELVPTKLPHYVLPLYPALALAAARAVMVGREAGRGRSTLWLERGFTSLWVLASLGFAGALVIVPMLLGGAPMLAGAVGAAGIGVLIWHGARAPEHRPESASLGVAAALFLTVAGFGFELPALDALWLSRSAADLVAAERRAGETVSSTGYAEPSLVYLMGTGTQLLPAAPAATALAAHRVALSLVAEADVAAFHAALGPDNDRLRALGRVQGFDYSNGKWLTLHLFRLADATEGPLP